jgi:glycosyltransferase involved in cell wall biosynthesis
VRHDLAIVTGTYHRLGFLTDMIASVRRCAGAVRYRVIVIDGGSSDGTQAWVHAQPDCHLIQQTGPLTGAVRAFNHGFSHAVVAGYPYVAHLNDDVELQTPGMLDQALDILRCRDRVAAVAFAFDLRGPYAFEEVHGHVYPNFGVIRREAGMAVAQAQGDPTGQAWWNPIYRTYGADTEFGCWLWRLGWAVQPEPTLCVHDRTPETRGDVLRQLNGSDQPNEDGRLFWRRWPSRRHLLEIGPAG